MDKTEEVKRYNCPLCKYKTDKPSDWIKHTNSKKHERNGKKKSILFTILTFNFSPYK